jgi:hypothetical protein
MVKDVLLIDDKHVLFSDDFSWWRISHPGESSQRAIRSCRFPIYKLTRTQGKKWTLALKGLALLKGNLPVFMGLLGYLELKIIHSPFSKDEE